MNIIKKDPKVLNTEEAKEYFSDKLNIETIVDVDTWHWFFTNDYCIGDKLNLPKSFVPMSVKVPHHLTPLNGLDQTIEDYISIYHKNDRQICSLQELNEYLNDKNHVQ